MVGGCVERRAPRPPCVFLFLFFPARPQPLPLTPRAVHLTENQKHSALANTGRKAAEEQYNQLADFDKFVQSSVWGALRPPMLAAGAAAAAETGSAR